jgi:membrane associated rhomboid family serine protease
VVGLWLFGSPIEREAGARRLVELMVAGALGGVVATLIGAYASIELLDDPVLGMAPVTSALLAGWGFQYAERPVSFLGTWTILGKNLAVALGALTVLLAFLSRSAASLASVGGLLAGALWMWLRLRLRRHTKSGRFRVVQGDRETPPGKRWLN